MLFEIILITNCYNIGYYCDKMKYYTLLLVSYSYELIFMGS